MNDNFHQFSNKSTINSNVFKVYHQNSRGLRNKIHELIAHLNSIVPHFICLTEHHLNILEKKNYFNIGYTVGAQYCRVSYKKGGAIIYIHNSLQHTTIDLSEFCRQRYRNLCN